MAGSSDSSGNWLMTYADFITLMMIFFIVLYTFTPGVEQSKFEAIIGAFQGKRGILRYESVFSDEQLDIDVQRAKNWDEFKRYIEEEDLSGDIQLEMMADGIRIVLGEAVTFDTYSARLVPKARKILKKIGEVLLAYKAEELAEIEIVGHTDDRPIKKDTARRYRTNWELGAARALSVVEFFTHNTDIAPRYFKASSYSQYHPQVPNNSVEHMQQNRRVEVYVHYKPKAKKPAEISRSQAEGEPLKPDSQPEHQLKRNESLKPITPDYGRRTTTK